MTIDDVIYGHPLMQLWTSPTGQYKFKADMRDRFRYHEDSYWQAALSGGPDRRSMEEDNFGQNKKDADWNWPPNTPWPLKRRKHQAASTDSRDSRGKITLKSFSVTVICFCYQLRLSVSRNHKNWLKLNCMMFNCIIVWWQDIFYFLFLPHFIW